MYSLCVGTHLLVDETVLTPGQLSEVGVQNLTALGNLIQWQKVSYDFQYHTAEFESNVVSERVNQPIEIIHSIRALL